jgi:hypothetical protein
MFKFNDLKIKYDKYKSNRKKINFFDINNSNNSNNKNNNKCKVAIIVPYRDRAEHLKDFINCLSNYKDKKYIDIYVIEQNNLDKFNRGLLLNIGFYLSSIENKYKYYIFHDVDSFPDNYLLDLYIRCSIMDKVVHFASPYNKYKYTFNDFLGGVIGLSSEIFLKINGFPNYWSWGYEDNELNNRAVNNRIQIDRSQFYPIMDKNIFQMKDGLIKVINRNEFDRYVGNSKEGIDSIKDVNYQYDKSSNLLNVSSFSTGIEPSPKFNLEYDIRKGSKPFGNINKGYRGSCLFPKIRE